MDGWMQRVCVCYECCCQYYDAVTTRPLVVCKKKWRDATQTTEN